MTPDNRHQHIRQLKEQLRASKRERRAKVLRGRFTWGDYYLAEHIRTLQKEITQLEQQP